METNERELYEKFKNCILFYGRFHIAFLSILLLQILSFILFFPLFGKSAAAAIGLALFFLTLFSYFVLHFFFQTRKPQQFLTIREEFFGLPPENRDAKTRSFSLLKSIEECVNFFSLEEKKFYEPATSLTALQSLLKKINVRLYGKDFRQMKELLLFLGVEELISLIKQFPTDPQVHANLALTYDKLSRLYWSETASDADDKKFTIYSERVIEELTIVEEAMPRETWVYKKLAESYRLQGKKEKEILQYEKLLVLSPDDEEALFFLGLLYFEEGFHAKGLQAYQKLQNVGSERTEELIEHYDIYPLYEPS